MKPIIVDVIGVVAALVVICILLSLYALRKRQLLKKQQLYQFPPSSELRRKQIPIIESVPFWVPGYITDVVDIEVQPSLKNLGPKFSTPKQRRHKTPSEIKKTMQLKFSVKYDAKRSTLTVNLLESKNLGQGNLVHDESLQDIESSIASGTGSVFNAVELTPPRPREDLPVVKRTRKNSYEFEMDYEDLQLQMLQFSVMAYDEYSRQKVIGDVILPMADFRSQGLDVTRELIMWREVQTFQKRSQIKEADANKNITAPEISSEGDITSDSRCSPS